MLDRPGLRGVVIEAYGAGNGPTEAWFLGPLRAAVDRGVTVVVTTQCRAGGVVGVLRHRIRAPGDRCDSGGDMTFEAALTKLMVLTDRHAPDEVRRLMQEDLAGELSSETSGGHGRLATRSSRSRQGISSSTILPSTT